MGKQYGLLALAAVLWGVQPMFVKLAVRELTPVTLTSFRYLLISGTLFGLLLWRKKLNRLPSLRVLPLLFCMGLTGVTINNVAQFTGLQYSTVTNATLIASTTPAMTAILAVLFLRERLLGVQWIGLLLSLFGTLYLVSHGSLDILNRISLNFGDMLFFLCQLCWAAYCLMSVRVLRELSVLETVAWSGLFGTLLTVLYGLYAGELRYAPISTACMGYLLYIIWGGGVCAMIFWNLGVKAVGASQSAIFLNLMPLIGIVCGILFLGENFRFQESFGAVAILSGVYLITNSHRIVLWRNRFRRRRRRRKAL